MLSYLLRTAWRSLRRNPALSLLVVIGIGLGIGVSTTFVTAFYRLSMHPMPEKAGKLFYVRMDSWNPDRPWDDDEPQIPPNQMTWRDASAVTAGDIPTYQSAMFKAAMTVHPEERELRPFRVAVRMCRHDFFPMFDVPFLYGGPWDDAADRNAEQVVVLDSETNDKLFGGENSVAREVRLGDRTFRVAGVLAPWRPIPKVYDTHNGPFEDPESIYMPIALTEPLEVHTAGNDSGWKSYDGDDFSSYLNSEQIWLQTWVQLDTPEQQEAYRGFLDAYALGQRDLGRFGRPLNNKITEMRDWLDEEHIVPDEARTMLIISLLFLAICSVNLVGILLGKFLSRAPEVGVRRALGASRLSVFMQHLVECELIALVGGGVGLLLSMLGLRVIEMLFSAQLGFRLDLNMVGAGVLLALVAGLLAGAYPAWRICRIPPAQYLKAQ